MFRCKRTCPFIDTKESREAGSSQNHQSVSKRLCANNVYQTHSVASRDGREVAMEMEHDANMNTLHVSTSRSQPLMEICNNNNNNNSLGYSVCLRCQSGEAGHYSHIGR